jgi:hypothetical protein
MINPKYVAIVAVALMFGAQKQPGYQMAEIGLYAPDLKAIRRLIGPGGAPALPPGDGYNLIANSWNQISPKGREFLLREPEIALVVVSSNGKWSYRSTGTIALRPLFNPGEALTPKDAGSLRDILESPWCTKLRDFYQAVLFGTGPYSPNGSRGGPSPAASYGLLLANVEQAGVAKEEEDWFRRLIGLEVMALDKESRDAVIADEAFRPEIRKALDAITEARNQQLDSVVKLSLAGTLHRVSMDHLALPVSSQGRTELGPFIINSVAGKRILSWSGNRQVIFVVPQNDNLGLPSEFSKQSLAALLGNGKARAFVSSPLADEIFEVIAPATR